MDSSIRDKFTVVIGLEVHAQLLTRTKIFAGDSTTYGSAPNTQISAITLGYPGTLPRLNKRAIELAVRMGLACHGEISPLQIFDRKNYFYPDLPKGYQITQDRTPLCRGGHVTITTREGVERNIGLNRIHLEEDAGKSIHLDAGSDSLVDFNRAGVPLIEIVTHPEIRSSAEAYAFLTEIRKLVRYLRICDGNMEEGSLRCDANISLMPVGASELGKKVEVKNLNSIRHVQQAIEHEISRQSEVLAKGDHVISETRTFDADTGLTHTLRAKEELNDYRYFPDPDLSPFTISAAWLNEIKLSMPELPAEIFQKFVSQFSLSEYDARVLTDSQDTALYFEEVCRHTVNFKAASNWVTGPVKAYLNEHGMSAAEFPVSPSRLAELMAMVDAGKVSFSVASQKIFPELIRHSGQTPLEVAVRLNVLQESDIDTLRTFVEQVVKEFPLKVEEYKNGKKGIVAMFMGEVMKRSKGKADPRVATELLIKKMNEL